MLRSFASVIDWIPDLAGDDNNDLLFGAYYLESDFMSISYVI